MTPTLSDQSVPLVIDLDGTLVRTDMLHESVLEVVRNHPWEALNIPLWLIQGKAFLKQKIAHSADIHPTSLPYNDDLIKWLRQQRNQGRTLILCTASDRSIADAIAKHLDLFDEVIASDGQTNLSGVHKAAMLQQRFGRSGFDYVGNTNADLVVWEVSRMGIVVSTSKRLQEKAERCCSIERFFSPQPITYSVWLHALRVHQWLKNLLLFVPIFAAHQFSHLEIWVELILAFFAFSLCTSAVYIMNDLLDLQSDRTHPYKYKRPFASGSLPIWTGFLLMPILLWVSFVLGAYVDKDFFFLMVTYFFVTCAYSWWIKRLILIDCLVLTILFTLRIMGGAIVADHQLSFWLLTFSIFLFLSLSFVKRYTELKIQSHNLKKKLYGRGYYPQDAPLIQSMGIASGYTAVLVLALYINSTAVIERYSVPEFLWGLVPTMFFWINWMWIQTHRDKMHDDPILFAVKDKASLFSGLVFLFFVGLATMGWSW